MFDELFNRLSLLGVNTIFYGALIIIGMAALVNFIIHESDAV